MKGYLLVILKAKQELNLTTADSFWKECRKPKEKNVCKSLSSPNPNQTDYPRLLHQIGAHGRMLQPFQDPAWLWSGSRPKTWRCRLCETWKVILGSGNGSGEVHRDLPQMRSLPLVVSLLLTEGVSLEELWVKEELIGWFHGKCRQFLGKEIIANWKGS